MAYEICELTREAEILLVQNARCAHDEIATKLAIALPTVFTHCGRQGIQMMGPPTTVYTEWGPGVVSMSAGLPVAEGSTGAEGIETFVYPGGRTLSTIHVGPYDALGKAHAAVEQHMLDNSLTSTGPAREIYLTDPGEVPDPAEW